MLAAASTTAAGPISQNAYGARDVFALLSPFLLVVAVMFVPRWTCCWRSCGAPGPAAARSARTRCICITGCSRSAIRTGGWCC